MPQTFFSGYAGAPQAPIAPMQPSVKSISGAVPAGLLALNSNIRAQGLATATPEQLAAQVQDHARTVTASPTAQKWFEDYIRDAYGGQVPQNNAALVDAANSLQRGWGINDFTLASLLQQDAGYRAQAAPRPTIPQETQQFTGGQLNGQVQGQGLLSSTTGNRKADNAEKLGVRLGVPEAAAQLSQKPYLDLAALKAEELGPTGLFGDPFLGALFTAGLGAFAPAAAFLSQAGQSVGNNSLLGAAASFLPLVPGSGAFGGTYSDSGGLPPWLSDTLQAKSLADSIRGLLSSSGSGPTTQAPYSDQPVQPQASGLSPAEIALILQGVGGSGGSGSSNSNSGGGGNIALGSPPASVDYNQIGGTRIAGNYLAKPTPGPPGPSKYFDLDSNPFLRMGRYG